MEFILEILLLAVAVIVLIRIFSAPIKLFAKLLLNAAIGVVLLFAFNTVASAFGYNVEITALSCAVSAILGVPGVILLILIEILL